MKIDLHTHCFEGIHISSLESVNPSAVNKIVTAVMDKGLDGIAVTEHYVKEFGFLAQKIVSESFNNQIVIIPGHEIYYHGYHLVELFLTDDLVFRFLPHPIYGEQLEKEYDFNVIHGIEIANSYYDNNIDTQRVRAIAEEYDLLILSNSDAHELDDVGNYYNEIDLDELAERVKFTR